MKKLLLLIAAAVAAIAMPQNAEADLVLGIDSWRSSATQTSAPSGFPAHFENGVSYSFARGNIGVNVNGSTDGTFGTSTDQTAGTTNAANSDGLRLTNGQDGFVTLAVTSLAGSPDLFLETFHFDAGASRMNAANDYELFLVDGATETSLGSGSTVVNPGLGSGVADFGDIDIDLSGEAIAFNAGDTVNFRLAFTGGTASSGHHLSLDNIGLSAVAVPEPSSMVVLGLAGLAVFTRRRR